MDKFVMKKSNEANNYKSIRFPVELDNKIKKIVEQANKGKKVKEYSFNGFVISACEFAIKHMNNSHNADDIDDWNIKFNIIYFLTYPVKLHLLLY